MQQQAGGLRNSMPGVAAIVDDLRRELGVAWANRIVAAGMKGSRGFYAWEVGPDGVLRDVGSSIDGARVRLVDGKPSMRPMPGLADGHPVGLPLALPARIKAMRGGDGQD